MKSARWFGLLMALAVLAPACAATPAITPVQATGQAVQTTVDPDWHLTQQEIALSGANTAESFGTTSASTTSAGAVQEELNEGAPFDQFIMDRFPNAAPRQFGALQTVVSGYCLGLVDSESIDYLTRDETIQDVVLAVSDDECDSMETSGALLRGKPVVADSWDEAVEKRFARTVWWFDRDTFAAKAERACQNGDSATALAPDTDLGLSVTIELAAFTHHGDCAMLSGSAAGGVRSVEAGETSIEATDPNVDVTIFFVRSTDDEDILDRTRDLYSLAVATGEVTRLTSGEKVNSVEVAPDGSKLAYVLRGETTDDENLYVSDLDGSNARFVATLDFVSNVRWTPDGTGILHSVEDENGDRAIARLDLADGSSTVVAERTQRDLWTRGLVGDHLLYGESDGNDPTLIRYDLANNEVVDALLVPYGGVTISPDGSQLITSERSTGEMSRIDMEADRMVRTPLASGPGKESAPAISPNNRYVAYGVGPEFRPTQIFVTDLDAPETRINLTADLETPQIGRSFWAPDSQSVFFSAGTIDEWKMFFVTLDGEVTDLGETGLIHLVVGN